MTTATKSQALALAFCIAGLPLFSQSVPTGACLLGEIPESRLSGSDSIIITIDPAGGQAFVSKAPLLKSLQHLEIRGEGDNSTWSSVFSTIRLHPKLASVSLTGGTFSSMPSGYEGLFNIRSLSVRDNDEIEQQALCMQLKQLPNLQELTMDIYTIYDVHDSLLSLSNLLKLTLINTDEIISGNDSVLVKSSASIAAYDFQYHREGAAALQVKYISTGGEIDSEEYEELKRRFSAVNSDPGAVSRQGYTPVYKYVKPPMKGIDVERNVYTVSPVKENVLVYASGTAIKIPANAFTDQAGKPVTGPVSISYREFRDPVDFMVSGIPMKYDTSGQISNFESAGMFEIMASIDDQPLKLAAGKTIDMNFVTTSADSTYNFYAFNDSSGNWEYQMRPSPVRPADRIVIKPLSNAYNAYRNALRGLWQMPDKSRLSERFESLDYVYTSYLDTNFRSYRHQYKKDGKHKSCALVSLVRLSRVRRTKDGEVLFKLRFLNSAHPELNEFNDIYFASNEAISVSEFRKKYFKGKYYNDIRITQNGSSAEIRLKGIKNIITLSADLVTLNDKNQAQKVKNYSARFKRYNNRLRGRERTFNRDAAKGRIYFPQQGAKSKKEKELQAYRIAKKEMSREELDMTMEEWLSYYDQLVRQQELVSSARNTLIQAISIKGTGIYNCDQLQRLDNPVEIFASYITEKKEEIYPSVAYLMDRKRNSVFQYDGYLGYSPSDIVINGGQRAQNTLMTINADGSIAVFTAEDFKKNSFRDKSEFKFEVKELGSGFSNVSELKKLLGM